MKNSQLCVRQEFKYWGMAIGSSEVPVGNANRQRGVDPFVK